MYKIILKNLKPKNVYLELIDVFLRPDEYICVTDENLNGISDQSKEPDSVKPETVEQELFFDGADYSMDRNLAKQAMFTRLSEITGKTPEWGIMTGIRPVKVAGELLKETGSVDQVQERLTGFYFLSDKKAAQIIEMAQHQKNLLGESAPKAVGIYIGIPFCPTRCLYCSFTSNKGNELQIQEYLKALHKEIRVIGTEMKIRGLYPESVYFGGGTPTTLSANQLEELISMMENSFNMEHCMEITMEAGRPDTITDEKLKVIASHGVQRISINPQTMKDETLHVIGRNHDSNEIREAFTSARKAGIPMINADLIAGLPGETAEDFKYSLSEVILMNADNITIHTLAVKRASRLIAMDSQFHYKQEAVVKEMLALGEEMLNLHGYRPYYLYRQKHMAGGLENVGYSKGKTEGIYNIRIMDEHQTIIALGAGGITKAYYPKENRLERVPNVSNFEIYVERIDEMIQRKKDNLF